MAAINTLMMVIVAGTTALAELSLSSIPATPVDEADGRGGIPVDGRGGIPVDGRGGGGGGPARPELELITSLLLALLLLSVDVELSEPSLEPVDDDDHMSPVEEVKSVVSLEATPDDESSISIEPDDDDVVSVSVSFNDASPDDDRSLLSVSFIIDPVELSNDEFNDSTKVMVP